MAGTPSVASAQFFGNAGFQRGGFAFRANNPFVGSLLPPPPVYAFQFSGVSRYALSVPGATGPINIGLSRSFSYGYAGNGYPFRPAYVVPPASTSGGYMTGGSVANPAIDNAQRNFEAAQRQAVAMRHLPANAKTAIYDQWAYEKLGVTGLPGLAKGDQPEALEKALAAADEAAVASGVALNHITVAIVALEGKGAKGASAFLPPNLLSEVRFGGSPTADALNVIRSSGKLEVPPAFDAEPLRPFSGPLERDFAALTAPVLLGKPVEQLKLVKFEATLKQAQDAAAPLVRTLPFEDAIAVRKFLNQLDAAAKVLKDPAAAGFVNPKWDTEGTNVADLVKHMTKYKLLFGPAGVGNEEAYLALHRGLSAYLFVLSQNVKK
ncbi:MAG TPA: hypothetical protein VMZ71_07450 [Gemmataceae bacterium]|nr:hypothetical protein [Gemmataceae bacterium]